ncbi:hypothetical protein J2S74_000150 [Evansella vedderi]|uniref:Hydrolase Nlp/P60 n=1 Tax=Evansella vedderi TaxID=38282 RepID=A0ABT9ZNF9_9BACI|nr:C40 family peptidase [Evansella vedderi]MDQ0252778.1 hypothetical protein [Evansella vedderi]
MRKFTVVSLAFVMLFTSLLFSPSEVKANSLRDEVIRIAKQYQGVPYQWGGTTPAGFDCSGFVQFVFREAGMSLTRTTRTQITEGTSVSRSNLLPGDLVFFNETGTGSTPSHNGIYIGNNRMIHSGSSRGVEIVSIGSGSYWGPKYIGARRVISDAPLPAGQFHDVPRGFWAHSEISAMSSQGYIVGFENSFFRPNEQITRASVAAIIARVEGLNGSSNNHFSDVPSGHWAARSIAATVDAGFMGGNGDGTFRPNAPMTRAEVASVFDRVFDLRSGAQSRQFSDVSSNHWARVPIQRMAASGITVGYSDGTFRPNSPISRAEFAVFLHRAMNQ